MKKKCYNTTRNSNYNDIKCNNNWTCPMHPKIESKKFDICSICGMGLDPKSLFSIDEVNPELLEMKKKFYFSIIFIIPLIIMNFYKINHLFMMENEQIIMFFLATPIVWISGWLFIARCVSSLKTFNLNMFILIGFGIFITYIQEFFAIFALDLFPGIFMINDIVPVYFETSAMIVFLVLLGQIFELKARNKTRNATAAY